MYPDFSSGSNFQKDKMTNSIQSHKSYRKYKLSENGRAYTDLWIYQRWDQVPWRSKHLLSIDHTRCEPFFQIRWTAWTVVKISVKNGLTIVMKQQTACTYNIIGVVFFLVECSILKGSLEYILRTYDTFPTFSLEKFFQPPPFEEFL
jgi:hypothetical protein